LQCLLNPAEILTMDYLENNNFSWPGPKGDPADGGTESAGETLHKREPLDSAELRCADSLGRDRLLAPPEWKSKFRRHL
jgi:hypothetical protein